MKRKNPNLTQKLAATLLMLKNGHGQPVIDPERAKGMSAESVIQLFEFDHNIHVAIGGQNHPSNLVPRIKAEHREKTAKIDIPQIAKTKRIARANDEHVNALLRKATGDAPEPRRKGPKLRGRSFPKPLEGRPKPSWGKRKMGNRK